MESWLKCQISPLVKYRQNQKNNETYDKYHNVSLQTVVSDNTRILIQMMVYFLKVNK